MHAIAATTADTSGHVVLQALPQQTPGATARRVNRVATLDGGAVLNDFGFSEADRTIELRWVPQSAVAEAAVARLVTLYSTVVVSTRSGCYLAAPESYTPGNESLLRLLVIEKLSA